VFEQSAVSFFDVHPYGIVLLIGLVVFPRLTIFIGWLVGYLATGGAWFWLGWFFVPRFLIALIATLSYWNTNPVLVVLSWLFALSGTTAETATAAKKISK